MVRCTSSTRSIRFVLKVRRRSRLSLRSSLNGVFRIISWRCLVGILGIVLRLEKGFASCRSGLIDRLPKITVVQAGAAPFARFYREHDAL